MKTKGNIKREWFKLAVYGGYYINWIKLALWAWKSIQHTHERGMWILKESNQLYGGLCLCDYFCFSIKL